MNRHRNLKILVLPGVVLSLAIVLLAQRPPKTLVVNGKPTDASVIQMNGHTYVDIETLAQLTHGSVKLEANRIFLTIPESTLTSPNTAALPQTAEGLSRDFASVAIVALGNMKEWRAAVETMVIYGLAATPAWARDYSDRTTATLQQATLAASTPADHNALQMLNHQFAALAKWANDVSTERRDLNGARTVDPNSLRTDPVLTKISDCDRFLNAMLVRGNVADTSGCR